VCIHMHKFFLSTRFHRNQDSDLGATRKPRKLPNTTRANARLDASHLNRQVPGRESGVGSGSDDAKEEEEAPSELVALLEERLAAKKSKHFARADEIRDLCAAAGYSIVDSKGGSSLKKVSA
jgi:cysteinyl-tRNA synthetase